jgi:tetratricopeptide (TPR) repeat protein
MRAGWWNSSAVRGAGIVLLTLLVYLPALRGDFTWNDDTFLYDNPLIRADDGLYRFWCTTQAPDYFPLVSTTLWLEWRLWGLWGWSMNAHGYHAVNVLLHALAAVLLWRVLQRLAIPGAWLAALIFAVHPVNVESAAWITERKNTLPLVFYALTLLGYLRFEQTGRRRWYGLALLAFLLALLGKTSVVMLPLVLLGCAWGQRGRVTRVDLWRSVPFFVLAVGLGLVTVWFQHYRAIGDDVVRTDGWGSRWAIAGWAVWFYLSKALLPIRLCFVYPRWTVDAAAWWPFWPAAALVAGFAVLAAYRRTWGRPFLLGLGYYVLTLLPVLGFVNIYFMRYSLVADHWQYPGLIGVIALVVGWACRWVERREPAVRRAAVGGAAVLVGVLSVLSWRQARLYETEEALYQDTLAKNPSAWLAHTNLGKVYHEQGKNREALHHLHRALELYPDYALAHFNLGNVLMATGNSNEALRHYEESVRLDPRAPNTHLNLGVLLAQQGRIEEAYRHFDTAVRLAPGWFDAIYNRGQTLGWLGKPEAAIGEMEKALQIKPDSAPAHYHLGNLLAGQGRPEPAATHFAEAVRLAPHWAEAHNNLGRALADQGHWPEAVEQYRIAVRLAPDFALAWRNLGAALTKLGRLDEAAEAYARAAKDQP